MENVSPQVIKVTQALGFLLSKDENHKISRIKLIKMLWAADRYHMRNFGRTVSGVDYVDMKHGPVASLALEIAQQKDSFALTDSDLKYVKTYLTSDSASTAMNTFPGDDYLSESDKYALEFAWKNFKDIEPFELADNLSHQYPEWKQYEKYFSDGNRSPKALDQMLFFENPDIKNDVFEEEPEQLDAAREIYIENQKINKLLES